MSNARALFLLALSFACATMPARAAELAGVRAAIEDAMAQEDLPSVAVAVARNGKVIWEEGFGWADRERRVRATARTPYSLASISKPYTATALMILVERGELSLDVAANDYLGASKLIAHVGDSREATLRRLANHSAGLPLYYQFFYKDEEAVRPSMEESIRRHGHIVRPPGEACVYSNFGYGVLEYVIERVSGKPYAEFMHDEVFAPLDMKESFVALESRSTTNSAVRYARNGRAVPFYDFDHRGASAVYASAHDLARFGMFHLKGRVPGQKAILSDAGLEEMQEPDVPENRDVDDKGMRGIGWGMRESYGLHTVGHTGSMAGVSTRLTLIPAHDIAIAILANASSSRLADVEATVVHALLSRTIRSPERVKLPERFFGEWSGAVHAFEGRVPVELSIAADGRVSVQVGSAPKAEVAKVGVDKSGALLLQEIEGRIGTAGAERHPYRLTFHLVARGDALNGAATAVARPVQGRIGNAISHWIELQRRH